MQLVQLLRVRLRWVARVAAQVAELMDLLGLAYLAQLARVVLFVALLLVLLLALVVRSALGLTVLSYRVLAGRLQALFRALVGTQLLLLLVVLCSGPEMDISFNSPANHKIA